MAGTLGVVLSGAMTAVLGVWLAAGSLAAIGRRCGTLGRHAAALLAVLVLATTAGTVAMRGETLTRFAEFMGVRDRTGETAGVESYAQRSLLAYLGLRIFLDEPLVGVGWQGSSEEWAYGPHLAEARQRFRDEPDEAFPSPERPWGVQNAYVQTLADLGVVGFAALLALFGTAVAVGLRGLAASPLPALGLAWLLVAAGVWNGLGLVAGIPLAALTWLAVGLVATRA